MTVSCHKDFKTSRKDLYTIDTKLKKIILDVFWKGDSSEKALKGADELIEQIKKLRKELRKKYGE